jgi:hypothetical protein
MVGLDYQAGPGTGREAEPVFRVGQPSSRKAIRSFGENEGSPERAHSAKGSETRKSLSVILGQYIQGLLAVLRTMSRMLPVC